MNRVRALLISFLGAAVLMAALSYDAVLWAQDFAAGFPGGGGRGIGLLNALYCQLASPCVLTGDNASGTGTLRIRPSDGDSQIVLGSALNEGATAQNTTIQQLNTTTAKSFFTIWQNGYQDSAGAFSRFNTSAGAGRLLAASGTADADNVAALQVYGLAGAAAGSASLAATAATASTFTIGGSGTVTTDIRGPILNGGIAPCNSVNAGSLCMNDTMMIYGGSGVPYLYIQPTANNLSSGISLLNSSGTGVGGLLHYGSGAAIMPNTNLISKAGVQFSVADTTDIAATSSFSTDVEDFDGTPIVHGGVYGDGADYKLAVSPTALSGNVDNYAGCTKARCRIDPNGANRNVTGLTQGADGKILTLCNISTGFNVVLMDSVTSTAANQFALDADFTILPERCQEVVYDGTSSRWRLNN